MMQLVGCQDLMLSHVLGFTPVLFTSLTRASPDFFWLDGEENQAFLLFIPCTSHIQPDKQPCHMPFARLGRASIRWWWPRTGHQPQCLQEAPAQSMELKRPQGSEGLFTGD